MPPDQVIYACPGGEEQEGVIFKMGTGAVDLSFFFPLLFY